MVLRKTMGKSTAAAVPVAPKNRENKVSGGLIEINNNASGVFLNTLIIRVICLGKYVPSKKRLITKKIS